MNPKIVATPSQIVSQAVGKIYTESSHSTGFFLKWPNGEVKFVASYHGIHQSWPGFYQNGLKDWINNDIRSPQTSTIRQEFGISDSETVSDEDVAGIINELLRVGFVYVRPDFRKQEYGDFYGTMDLQKLDPNLNAYFEGQQKTQGLKKYSGLVKRAFENLDLKGYLRKNDVQTAAGLIPCDVESCFPQYDFAILKPAKTAGIIPLEMADFECDSREEVIYAGYPLNIPHLVELSGKISSTYTEGGVDFYLVDGTTVAGLSGSPIVAVRQQKPFAVGMLDLQAADITEEFREASAKLKNMRSGVLLLGPLSVIDMFKQLEDIIVRNMSTNLGKVIRIKQLWEAAQEKPRISANIPLLENGDLAVPKNNATCSGIAGRTRYNEVKWGRNRGIRVTRDSSDKTYKLSPNPHDNRQYNRNQARFYHCLAILIDDFFDNNNAFPQSNDQIEVMREIYTLEER